VFERDRTVTFGFTGRRAEPLHHEHHADFSCQTLHRSERFGYVRCSIQRHDGLENPMTFPFVVLDQNQLQRADKVAVALDRCCRDNLQILIPDVAGYELSKGSNPTQTWFRCLQPLASFSELVVASKTTKDLRNAEITSGRACADLVDHELTVLLRQTLRDVSKGDLSGVSAILDRMSFRRLDADQIKSAIKVVHDHLKASLSKDSIASLKRSPDDGVVTWLSSVDGVRLVFQGVQACGVTSKVAIELATTQSVTGGVQTGIVAVALDWLATGGLEGARSERFANDLCDIEYGILGAASQCLATDDERAKRVCNAIKHSVSGRAQWFARAIDLGSENA
jgi:hypothetical protein